MKVRTKLKNQALEWHPWVRGAKADNYRYTMIGGNFSGDNYLVVVNDHGYLEVWKEHEVLEAGEIYPDGEAAEDGALDRARGVEDHLDAREDSLRTLIALAQALKEGRHGMQSILTEFEEFLDRFPGLAWSCGEDEADWKD